MHIGDVEIDLSTGCGGVWFDQHELEKFDEVHEAAGTLLIEHMQQYHRPLEDAGARLKCPKDIDVVMMRRYYSSRQQIAIDECPQCGGIWLDAEELAGIRELFPTRQHLQQDARAFVDKVMNSPEVKAYEEESRLLPEKLASISRVLWSILR